MVVVCCSRRVVSDGEDQQDDERQAEGLSIPDEDAQLIREETEMVLDCVPWRGGVCCRGAARHDFLAVDWIPETDQLDSRDADAHSPAHALHRDLLWSTGEFAVLDLAVVVVVARVDLSHFLLAQVFDDVLGDQGCKNVLILVACL